MNENLRSLLGSIMLTFCGLVVDKRNEKCMLALHKCSIQVRKFVAFGLVQVRIFQKMSSLISWFWDSHFIPDAPENNQAWYGVIFTFWVGIHCYRPSNSSFAQVFHRAMYFCNYALILHMCVSAVIQFDMSTQLIMMFICLAGKRKSC